MRCAGESGQGLLPGDTGVGFNPPALFHLVFRENYSKQRRRPREETASHGNRTTRPIAPLPDPLHDGLLPYRDLRPILGPEGMLQNPRP